MEINDKDPKQYELAILVKNEDQLSEIAAFLGQHQATIAGEPKIKKIALAYPVKKEREAYFGSYLFSALPGDAKKIEQDLALRQDILRSMIINAVPNNEHRAPSGDATVNRRRTKPISKATESESGTPRQTTPTGTLSNEALEKQIEEILK